MSRRWRAIAFFAIVPWLAGTSLYLAQRAVSRPPEPDECELKIRLLAKRGPVDTLISGDSRSERIGGPEFTKRGWNYFNMALGGTGSEDMIAGVMYSVLTQPVKRVIIGVSFDSMAHETPFELSIYKDQPVYLNPAILRVTGNPELSVSPGDRVTNALDERLGLFLPIGFGHAELHTIRTGIRGPDPAAVTFEPDGRAIWVKILHQIADGTWSRGRDPRDPYEYYLSQKYEAPYLSTRRLSPSAEQLFERFVSWLRGRGLVVLFFETGRTEAYRKLLKNEPEMLRLQAEWRRFIAGQTGGCTRFIEDGSLRSLYEFNDFFDAVHFLAPSMDRLSAKLAEQLDQLERDCSGSAELRH